MGGFLLGLADKAQSAWANFMVAGMAGAAGAELAKILSGKSPLGIIIAFLCGVSCLILAMAQIDYFLQFGQLAWGSVLIGAGILLGLFGSWARWQQDSEAR